MLREYLAMVLQEVHWHAAARRMRGHARRNAAGGFEAATSLKVIHSDHSSAVPGASGGGGPHDPFIADTPTERHLQFSGQALQSRMRLDNPYALVATYTRQMLSCLLFNPDPEHLLMIGLGGGSMQKFCYRHLPRTRITTIEIDARVIALRESFHVPPDNTRFRVMLGDAAQCMSQVRGPVDAILIDAFDADGVAPTLASADFFRAASQLLMPDGVLIMNLHGHPARYQAHVEHARVAFDDRAVLAPVTGNDNLLLFAFRERALVAGAPHLNVRARYLQRKLGLLFEAYLQRLRKAKPVELPMALRTTPQE